MNKFCILAAGKGTRATKYSGLHKGLLPLENKPVISHILEHVSKEIPIVIAVGHLKEQLVSYVKHVHSDRDIEFVEIDNYDGEGSGPGLSLYKCKDLLQCPYIFTSVDTLCDVPMDWSRNWLATSWVVNKKYCLIKANVFGPGRSGYFSEPQKPSTFNTFYYEPTQYGDEAYTGIAGVNDYKTFWERLSEKKIIQGEYQVVHGFDDSFYLESTNTWFDTGDDKSYKSTLNWHQNNVARPNIVCPKEDEILYIDNGWVVKYHVKASTTTLKLIRSKFLPGVPEVCSINDNMYAYKYQSGELLSNVYDASVLQSFLEYYHVQYAD